MTDRKRNRPSEENDENTPFNEQNLEPFSEAEEDDQVQVDDILNDSDISGDSLDLFDENLDR
jgi:hypothetical protein